MPNFVAQEWYEQLTLTRNLHLPGDRNAFYAQARQGLFIPISRGAYLPRSVWAGLDDDAKYRARVRAVAALSRDELLFSHHSAAAIWRLPRVGRQWRDVHVITAHAKGGTSGRLFRRHTVGIPDAWDVIDGLKVTTLTRTVVDMARSCPLPAAVAIADTALRRTVHPTGMVPRTSLTPDDLIAELDGVPLRHASARARLVIELADARADRPGESVSRVNMKLAGIAAPELQVSLLGASAKRYLVDFWWPDFDVIGEFDGRAKYNDPAFMGGRTAEQVVYDEKLREDDLRAAGYRMVRWNWDTATSPRLLATRLLAAGVAASR